MPNHFQTGGLAGRMAPRLAILLALTMAGGAALIAATAMSSEGYERLLSLLVALVLGGAVTACLLRSPQLALAVLVAASLLVPSELGTGTRSSVNASLLVAPIVIGAWLILVVSRREHFSFVHSRTTVPLLAFMAVTALSLIVGQFPWFPVAGAPMAAQLAGLAMFLLSGGVFLVAAHVLRDMRWLRIVTWVFFLAAGVHIVAAVVPGLGATVSRVLPAGATGSMFWTWLLALGSAQVAFNRDLKPVSRVAIGILVVAAVLICLLQKRDWLSGWMPGLVAIIVMAVLRRPLAGFMGAILATILAVVNGDQVLEGIVTSENRYSLLTRVEAFRRLVPILKADPVLGLGPANYYHYTRLNPIMGWHVKFNSHNNYLDILAQTGILGLGCFIWFALELCRTGWRLRYRPSGSFEQAYVYGALGGLAGTLVAAAFGDWLIPFVYNVGVEGFRASILAWIFLGGLVAVDQTEESA